MSRRNGNGEGRSEHQPWTQEEALAIEQSLDVQMLEHVKELLCTLWKQGRIHIGARSAGDAAVGAARHAVENPARRNITLDEGARVGNAQWFAQQEALNHDF